MKKTPVAGGKTSVTFDLPAIEADTVVVCGDFNDWSHVSHPLKRRKDGSFATTVRLGPGRYQFRYLIDGRHWENDWSADTYAPNEHGSDDSVVVVEPAPKKSKVSPAASAKTGSTAPTAATRKTPKPAKAVKKPSTATKKAAATTKKANKPTSSAKKKPKA
jgi:1,4-alpha-glucan branching enzyme